jgi:hypothetical protein
VVTGLTGKRPRAPSRYATPALWCGLLLAALAAGCGDDPIAPDDPGGVHGVSGDAVADGPLDADQGDDASDTEGGAELASDTGAPDVDGVAGDTGVGDGPAADDAPVSDPDGDVPSDVAVDGAADAEPVRPTPLVDSRDRLLDTYADAVGASRCQAWAGMTRDQRGVFLTITDLLGNRSWLTEEPESGPREGDDLDTALDHVTRVVAVRGADTDCLLPRCCGGVEFNRLYVVADERLIATFRGDAAGLPAWRPSSDLAGPHDPFTQSAETYHGQPRGQAHFFASDGDAVVLERPGVEGVLEPHLVEIDIDYNLFHESSPECDYRLGTISGRELYEEVWAAEGTSRSVELDYVPTSCESR